MSISKTSMLVAVGVSLTGLVAGCRAPATKMATGALAPDGTIGGVQTAVPPPGMLGDPFPGEGSRGQFAPVYFAYDSSSVSDTERAAIETVASYLRASPNARLVIEGHGDERGSNEYNLALGERRALAVRAYLGSLGIGSDRIQTRSFGEEQPVQSGHAEDSWRLNRRAEFVVFGQ
ncbi:MAG: peptidoglycan-associated lipoprotein [Planctomycetes bacterium]|nr:peptidoglycan-associated lipoprotein [Planctomycetota bacterium]